MPKKRKGLNMRPKTEFLRKLKNVWRMDPDLDFTKLLEKITGIELWVEGDEQWLRLIKHYEAKLIRKESEEK
jgi:hypothetical protein